MKSNIIKITLSILTLTLTSTGCIAFTNGLGSATIRVCIIDDVEQPVKGVKSRILSESWYDAPSGFSDTNGMFSVYLKDIYLGIGGWFTKDGYYKSHGMFWKWGMSGNSIVPPANTNFTIVLKRIVEPVPMRSKTRAMMPEKSQYTTVPRLDEPVGYDLEIGDWVFPDGKGKITDVFFTVTGFYHGINEFELKMFMEIPGAHNGFQTFHYPKSGAGALLRSELPPPVVAPESGYEKTFEFFTRRIPTRNRTDFSNMETRRWLFRIRTEINEEGEIISANYGWTTEDISFGTFQGKGLFTLFYYYNPDQKSRSLEPKEIADRQNRD